VYIFKVNLKDYFKKNGQDRKYICHVLVQSKHGSISEIHAPGTPLYLLHSKLTISCDTVQRLLQ
jgi:hypothetical protein